MVAAGGAIVAGAKDLGGMAMVAPYALAYVASMLLVALGTILKERAFMRGRAELGESGLNVFVVNTFGSLFQVHPLSPRTVPL